MLHQYAFILWLSNLLRVMHGYLTSKLQYVTRSANIPAHLVVKAILNQDAIYVSYDVRASTAGRPKLASDGPARC